MTKRQQSAFVAGLLLGVAFFLIRLAGVVTFSDVILAVGLTLIEIGVVWLVEKWARKLEPDIERCRADNAKRGVVGSLVQSGIEMLARRQKILEDTNTGIAAVDRDFEINRTLGDAKTLTAMAANAVRGGYYVGISANAGELGGVAAWR